MIDLNTTLILVVGVLFIYTVKELIQVSRKNHRLSKLPNPGLRWYFGGVVFDFFCKYMLFQDKRSEIMDKTREYASKHGEIYVGFVGWIGFVSINGGQLIREVSQKSDGIRFKKNFGYELSAPLLGNSLLLSSGSFWHKQRKIMEAGFTYAQISRVLAITNMLIEEKMASWNSQLQSNKLIRLDGYQEMLTLTADTIGIFTFSEKFNGKLAKAFGEVLDGIFWFIFVEGISKYIKYIPTPLVIRYRKSLRFLRQTIRSLIRHRRSLLLSQFPNLHPAGCSGDDDNNDDHYALNASPKIGNDGDDEGEEEGRSKYQYRDQFGDDMLNILLKHSTQMTEKQLEDECIGLIFAGHDTTASTLTWALVLLAQNEEIQSQLYQDLLIHFPPPFVAPLKIAQIEKSKYLDLVIKEVLRLYPPAIIGRTSLQDQTLTGKDGTIYDIPKGSEIFINFYALHRNTEVWGDDADLFNPERMANYQSNAEQANSYLPFGEVPRNCIGRKFALLEIKMTLVHMVMKYSFSLNPSAPSPSLCPAVTLHPSSVHLLLTPRM